MSRPKSIQTRVLHCLEGGVTRTAHELASILAEPVSSVTGRIMELQMSGLVEAAGKGPRRAGVKTGTNPRLWRLRKSPNKENPNV
jgi:predicted ArsR family transcriptional regulator